MVNIVHIWVVVSWVFSGTPVDRAETEFDRASPGTAQSYQYAGELSTSVNVTEKGYYSAPLMDRAFSSADACQKAIKDGRYRVSDRRVSLGCEEHVVEEADYADVKLINEEGN